jgi:hypothetical protein
MIPAEPSIVDNGESCIRQGIVCPVIFANEGSSPTTKAPLTNTITDGSNAPANQGSTMLCAAAIVVPFVESLVILTGNAQRRLVLVVSDVIWVPGMANMPDG